MENLITALKEFLWYKPYVEPISKTNIVGAIQTALVVILEMIFFVVKFIAMIFYSIIQIISSLDFYDLNKQWFYDKSKVMFSKFAGNAENITAAVTNTSTVSLITTFLLLSVLYLAHAFFISKSGNFGKKALHLILVIFFTLAYFSPITVGKTQKAGGIYFFDTVNNVSKDIQTQMLASFDSKDSGGDKSLTQSIDIGTSFYNMVVVETANFMNTGSFEGTFTVDGNGKTIDETKFDFQKAYSADSEVGNYLDGKSEDGINLYVKADGKHLADKFVAILLAFVNIFVVGIPVLVITLIISVVKLLILVLILFLPVILLLSFLPSFQTLIWKFLKVSMSFFFFPCVLTLILSIYMLIARMIDSSVVGAVKLVVDKAGIVGFLSLYLGATISAVLKIVLIILSWKNKEKALTLFNTGAVSNAFNHITSKAGNFANNAKNVAELGAGMSTMNPAMILDSVRNMHETKQGGLSNSPARNAFSNLSGDVGSNLGAGALETVGLENELSKAQTLKNAGKFAGKLAFGGVGTSLAKTALQSDMLKKGLTAPIRGAQLLKNKVGNIAENQLNSGGATIDDLKNADQNVSDILSGDFIQPEFEQSESSKSDSFERLKSENDNDSDELLQNQTVDDNLQYETNQAEIYAQAKEDARHVRRDVRKNALKDLVSSALIADPIRAKKATVDLLKTNHAVEKAGEKVGVLKDNISQNVTTQKERVKEKVTPLVDRAGSIKDTVGQNVVDYKNRTKEKVIPVIDKMNPVKKVEKVRENKRLNRFQKDMEEYRKQQRDA